MSEPETIVVPLLSDMMALDGGEINPWELIGRGQAALVSFDPNGKPAGGFGLAASGTSELAKALGQVLLHTGKTATSNKGLFNVELPVGAILSDLVPAVGGGFRGMVTSGVSKRIAGHVRLLPAASGTAATSVALGPVIAVMGVAIGAEMIARKQTDAKLDAIQASVSRLEGIETLKREAELRSAQRAIESAAAALLDSIQIPESIGLGPARNDVRRQVDEGLHRLTQWEEGLKKAKSSRRGIRLEHMRQDVLHLPEKDISGATFVRSVANLYDALALDSRAEVLTAVEATARNPGRVTENLHERVRAALSRNAETQERLRNTLWALAERPVAVAMPAKRSTTNAAGDLSTVLSQVAASAAKMPDAPGVLNSIGQQHLQLEQKSDGSVAPQAAE